MRFETNASWRTFPSKPRSMIPFQTANDENASIPTVSKSRWLMLFFHPNHMHATVAGQNRIMPATCERCRSSGNCKFSHRAKPPSIHTTTRVRQIVRADDTAVSRLGWESGSVSEIRNLCDDLGERVAESENSVPRTRAKRSTS